jgi:UDP-glucose 4-epimerase
MRILVTGSTGFIGRHVLRALSRMPDTKVFALTRDVDIDERDGVTRIAVDLSMRDWTRNLPSDGIDVVLHLAQSRRYREFPACASDIFNVNVKSTVDLAEWAIEAGVKKFLFASTGNVYGSKDRIFREDDVCQPDSMYGASKLSAEILLRPFSNFFDIAVLRLFCVFGPGQEGAMMPGIIGRFVEGSEITLAGNIGVKFNPIYIDDCVSVVVRMMEKKLTSSFEVLNVGGDETVDIRRVAAELEGITKNVANVRVTDDAPKYLVGSIDKLSVMVASKGMMPFRDGLRRTVDAFIANKNAY